MELVNHEEPVSEEHAAQLRRYNVIGSKWHYCRSDAPMNGYRLRLQFDPLFSAVYLCLGDQALRAFELGWDNLEDARKFFPKVTALKLSATRCGNWYPNPEYLRAS